MYVIFRIFRTDDTNVHGNGRNSVTMVENLLSLGSGKKIKEERNSFTNPRHIEKSENFVTFKCEIINVFKM